MTIDRLVFERTVQVAVAANATAVSGQLISIPLENGVRPIAFSIADAAADLSVEVAVDPDESGAVELTAADLLPNAGAKIYRLGPNDQIALEAAAGATTADIRWFYPAGAAHGHGSAPVLNAMDYRTQTIEFTAVALPAPLTTPEGAFALVIENISAGGASNGLTYAMGPDGGASTEKIPLLQGDAIDDANPYTIWLKDVDDVYVERITADATVQAKWLIAL